MTTYNSTIEQFAGTIQQGGSTWGAISPEHAARMALQNRFNTGLDIARYTARIMRHDMARYDEDVTRYTQSLGCWHGFIGQQKMIAVKKHHGTTAGRYLYLSAAGWSPHCARSSAHFPTSRCTRRPWCPSSSLSCTTSSNRPTLVS